MNCRPLAGFIASSITSVVVSGVVSMCSTSSIGLHIPLRASVAVIVPWPLSALPFQYSGPLVASMLNASNFRPSTRVAACISLVFPVCSGPQIRIPVLAVSPSLRRIQMGLLSGSPGSSMQRRPAVPHACLDGVGKPVLYLCPSGDFLVQSNKEEVSLETLCRPLGARHLSNDAPPVRHLLGGGSQSLALPRRVVQYLGAHCGSVLVASTAKLSGVELLVQPSQFAGHSFVGCLVGFGFGCDCSQAQYFLWPVRRMWRYPFPVCSGCGGFARRFSWAIGQDLVYRLVRVTDGDCALVLRALQLPGVALAVRGDYDFSQRLLVDAGVGAALLAMRARTLRASPGRARQLADRCPWRLFVLAWLWFVSNALCQVLLVGFLLDVVEFDLA